MLQLLHGISFDAFLEKNNQMSKTFQKYFCASVFVWREECTVWSHVSILTLPLASRVALGNLLLSMSLTAKMGMIVLHDRVVMNTK